MSAVKLLPPRGRVVDVGCGTGLIIEFLRSTGLLSQVEELVCLDVSSGMLSVASRRASEACGGKCSLVAGDALRLPFKDGSFDVAYSFSVINLLEDPAAAMNEVARVSRASLVTLVSRLRVPEPPAGWRYAGPAGKDVAYVRP